jgi:glyoxylase-like metal-dependent hydrolase (beta-lactamase superfamily II)
VDDGDILEVGELRLEILHTPGHTPDSMCILVEGHLVTGDTLFVGKVGGTSTRGESETEAESLRRLMALDGQTTVWPGHDVGTSPSSTIARETETNPFCLRLGDFGEFHHLKENWAAYKEEHGIA